MKKSTIIIWIIIILVVGFWYSESSSNEETRVGKRFTITTDDATVYFRESGIVEDNTETYQVYVDSVQTTLTGVDLEAHLVKISQKLRGQANDYLKLMLETKKEVDKSDGLRQEELGKQTLEYGYNAVKASETSKAIKNYVEKERT